jgi:hypothetical protein
VDHPEFFLAWLLKENGLNFHYWPEGIRPTNPRRVDFPQQPGSPVFEKSEALSCDPPVRVVTKIAQTRPKCKGRKTN